jgi:hypothetical protein
MIANFFVFGVSFALTVGCGIFVFTLAHIYFDRYDLTEKEQAGLSLLSVIIVMLLIWR